MAVLLDEKPQREGFLEKANKTIVPMSGAIAAVVALIGNQEPLIKYTAIVVSVVLTIAVIFEPLHSFVRLIGRWTFPKRLSGEQRRKLTMLLLDSSAYVSSNHTYSVFYTWGSLAQTLKIPNWSRSSYFDVIRHQLFDMLELTKKFPRHEAYFLEKLSLVVRDVANAAESIQVDLVSELLKDGVGASERGQVRAGWNGCIDAFNLWLKEWERLFKESNHFLGTRCVEYIPIVKRID